MLFHSAVFAPFEPASSSAQEPFGFVSLTTKITNTFMHIVSKTYKRFLKIHVLF